MGQVTAAPRPEARPRSGPVREVTDEVRVGAVAAPRRRDEPVLQRLAGDRGAVALTEHRRAESPLEFFLGVLDAAGVLVEQPVGNLPARTNMREGLREEQQPALALPRGERER